MRIIAGELRGRRIQAPPGRTTRPTLDKVREALFSILGDLNGQSVIDCYAGSGALGLEALSRGAARAVLIEKAPDACAVIRDNIAALGVGERAQLVCRRLEQARGMLAACGPFDLVLADPPWAIAESAAAAIAKILQGLMNTGGRLVIGHRAREPVSLAEGMGFALADRRHWGDSGMSFFLAR